jgi:hypothetical protein
MSTVNLTREQLAQYILSKAKESSISKIRSIILNEENESDIVAYTVEGQALTISDYKKEIEKGIEDIKSGRVISDTDLAKEIETW